MTKQKAGRLKRRSVGVKVLKLADGRSVARWRDPLTGKHRQQSLDLLGLTSDEKRRQWAGKKAKQLADLRQAVALGAVRSVRVTVTAAVAEYLEGVAHEPTRESKRVPLEAFAEQVTAAGVAGLADLSGPLLIGAWRDWCVSAKRGRAESTRNRWLAVVGSS